MGVFAAWFQVLCRGFNRQKKVNKENEHEQNSNKKLFVDESRIWNLEEPSAVTVSTMSTKIRSILFGYMWIETHIESMLNIRGTSRDLATMGINEKKNLS